MKTIKLHTMKDIFVLFPLWFSLKLLFLLQPAEGGPNPLVRNAWIDRSQKQNIIRIYQRKPSFLDNSFSDMNIGNNVEKNYQSDISDNFLATVSGSNVDSANATNSLTFHDGTSSYDPRGTASSEHVFVQTVTFAGIESATSESSIINDKRELSSESSAENGENTLKSTEDEIDKDNRESPHSHALFPEELEEGQYLPTTSQDLIGNTFPSISPNLNNTGIDDETTKSSVSDQEVITTSMVTADYEDEECTTAPESQDNSNNNFPPSSTSESPESHNNIPLSTVDGATTQIVTEKTTLKTEDGMLPREPVTPDVPITTLTPSTVSTPNSAFCTFGTHPDENMCGWSNSNNTALNWKAGTGKEANWVGGPFTDFNDGNDNGGYAFVETSKITALGTHTSSGALLQSPILESTQAQGHCFTFSYIINGLSPKGLRLFLQPVISNTTYTVFQTQPKVETLWQDDLRVRGEWEREQILYTYRMPHKLVLEALPVETQSPTRSYRGYIAVDNILLQEGIYCQGFCTFSAGFCDWNNEPVDDFDWSLGLGSDNPLTGPAMGRSSLVGGIMTGGFAYIDSNYPRRTDDVARLASATFPATGSKPLCMKFWFHMYGQGIGTLRIFLRRFALQVASSPNQEIWKLSGNVGNSWYMGQITVSSIYDFQMVIEASVGSSGLGNIAVDDITFSHGPCSASPQVAGTILGDCTFEFDDCGWSNENTDIIWERVPGDSQKGRFQSKIDSSATGAAKSDYYLQLSRRTLQRPGTAARIISREIEGSDTPRCITFWYFMHEPFIDLSGPSLGALRVLLMVTSKKGIRFTNPLWELYNHQRNEWSFAQATIKQPSNYSVIFEGLWGPNRAGGSLAIDDIVFYNGECNTKPKGAKVHVADCRFDSGTCGWQNWTRNAQETFPTWKKAEESHRPAQLQDVTFGTAGGYIFFDIFSTNRKQNSVWLMSPKIDPQTNGGQKSCLTFWFAAFGAGETTHLRVIMVEDPRTRDPENGTTIWSLTAKGLDTARPTWIPGQVKLISQKPFTIFFEGKADNGGFAVDDIRVLPGSCLSRPQGSLANA